MKFKEIKLPLASVNLHLGRKMRMIEFLNKSTDWGDLSMIGKMFHDDYMYLREIEMLSRDEFIIHN